MAKQTKDKLGQEPVFPIVNSDGFCTSFENTQSEDAGAIGINKRFYAACCAMQGLLAAPGTTINKTMFQIINESFSLADEFLKQENK